MIDILQKKLNKKDIRRKRGGVSGLLKQNSKNILNDNINKRATVMVNDNDNDNNGSFIDDKGRIYSKYCVPLSLLKK
ncbi:MAG: hypothetical protein GX154_10725 [Clostridiales bacterium]|nr:hypothetical protein [Clostridiales bacterium]